MGARGAYLLAHRRPQQKEQLHPGCEPGLQVLALFFALQPLSLSAKGAFILLSDEVRRTDSFVSVSRHDNPLTRDCSSLQRRFRASLEDAQSHYCRARCPYKGPCDGAGGKAFVMCSDV